MRHCTSKNLTFAFPRLGYKNLLYTENNQLKGILGALPNKYLELDKPKLKNSSFTGGLKLLKEGKIDAYGKPEAMHLDEDFLKYSKTIFQERFLIGQIGIDLTKDPKAENFLSIFDLEIHIKYLALLAFTLTFLLLVELIKMKPFKRRLIYILDILLNSENVDSKYTSIALIVLFYNVYSLLFMSIFTNNIKTTKVLLNTSEILESKEDLLRSSKTICWLEDEFSILSMAKKAEPNTFLYKLYNKKQINYFNDDYSKCQFGKTPSSKMLRFMNNLVFLLSQLSMSGLFTVASSFKPDDIYYVSDKSVFQMIMVFYYRRNLDISGMAFITSQEFECALQEDLSKKMAQRMVSLFEYKTKLYHKKSDFVKEFTSFDDLGFDYFSIFFIYGFYFFCLLIIVKCVEIALTKIKKIKNY